MPASHPPVPGRYIDPLVDYAFKKIFGSEPNKDLLIHFLNEVFRGRKVITDLQYSPTEYAADDVGTGNVIFDLHCTGSNGESFIIEVQRQSQYFFKERALYYTSRLINNQAPKGGTKKWKYDVKEVYLVALLEKTTLEGSPADTYLHDISLCYNDTGQVFYNKLGFTYIELGKFKKGEDELKTDLDKWLYVLKNLSKMDKLPVYLRKPIFEKLFQIAEYTNLTKEEKTMYDDRRMYQWDNDNVMEYLKEKAEEKGIEIGIEKGEERKALTIGAKLKNFGYPVQEIAEVTGLTIEQIEAL